MGKNTFCPRPSTDLNFLRIIATKPSSTSTAQTGVVIPTFIVNTAIGVFLTSHQLINFLFSQPLTWVESKMPVQYLFLRTYEAQFKEPKNKKESERERGFSLRFNLWCWLLGKLLLYLQTEKIWSENQKDRINMETHMISCSHTHSSKNKLSLSAKSWRL